MPAHMELVLAWISHYGYAGVFALLMFGIAGLPIPDETILVFCGYLIWAGRMNPALIFGSALAGSICGISLSYVIGRTAGYRVLSRYGRYVHIKPKDIDRVHRWFQHIGEWLLTLGYFIPGVRHLTAFVAGMSGLEYPAFALFAYLGAALWVGTFLVIGYFVGDKWQAAVAVVHHYLLLAAGVAILVIALIWFLRPLAFKLLKRNT
jgi:membrane protein DedA with SNARE-associated domain